MRRFREYLPPPGAVLVLGLLTLVYLDARTQAPDIAPALEVSGSDLAVPADAGPEWSHQRDDTIVAAALAERPLFMPDRRPLPPPPAEPVEVAEVKPPEPVKSKPLPPKPVVDPRLALQDARLLGVMDDEGQRHALVSNGEDEVWLALGDEFEGWTVTEISRTSLELQNQSIAETFKIFDPSEVSQ